MEGKESTHACLQQGAMPTVVVRSLQTQPVGTYLLVWRERSEFFFIVFFLVYVYEAHMKEAWWVHYYIIKPGGKGKVRCA